MSNEFKHIEQPIIDGIENPKGTKVPIEFINKSIEDGAASRLAERRVFKDEVYIKFYIDRLSHHERKVTEQDKHEYARQWDAFLNKKKQKEDGIPLGMLPGLTESDIANLESLRIYTIERLANVPENVIRQIGAGARGQQQRAQAYIAQSSSAEVKVKNLEAQLAEMSKKIQDMENRNEPVNNSARRGGRNSTVRAANDGNSEQQQGSAAVA